MAHELISSSLSQARSFEKDHLRPGSVHAIVTAAASDHSICFLHSWCFGHVFETFAISSILRFIQRLTYLQKSKNKRDRLLFHFKRRFAGLAERLLAAEDCRHQRF